MVTEADPTLDWLASWAPAGALVALVVTVAVPLVLAQWIRRAARLVSP